MLFRGWEARVHRNLLDTDDRELEEEWRRERPPVPRTTAPFLVKHRGFPAISNRRCRDDSGPFKGSGMRRFTFSTSFYETYSIATALQNILEDSFEYAGLLDGFFCDDGCLAVVSPFPKQSALHVFIGWIVDGLLYEETTGLDLEDRKRTLARYANIPAALEDLAPTRTPLEAAFEHYGIEVGSFVEWITGQNKTFAEAEADDLYDWFQDLRLTGWIEELADRIAKEVFFVVFQNRTLLLAFNELVAGHVSDVDPSELEDPDLAALFLGNGRLARVNPPKWAQRAVFHRERGHCAFCHKDVSGTLSVGELLHVDHVVPLARGGLNDVTNLQLLCEECNLKKGAARANASTRYEPWYDDDTDD
jgi:hypothetical protein